MSSSAKDRVLLRVESIDKHHLFVVIIGWDPHSSVMLSRDLLPKHISAGLSDGDYIIARVNLGARFARDLHPSDFEEAPEPAML